MSGLYCHLPVESAEVSAIMSEGCRSRFTSAFGTDVPLIVRRSSIVLCPSVGEVMESVDCIVLGVGIERRVSLSSFDEVICKD